jgi:Protein of unknown function (DUF4038)/IPT/TIG domain/Putative collagen-binding domain of a collagenase
MKKLLLHCAKLRHTRASIVLLASVTFACICLPSPLIAATAVTYVQGNYATPQSAQTTVNVTFTGAQSAGDLNVVVVGWNDTTATVSSVTDRSGNSYTLGVGPTLFSGFLSQSIYYAKNIASAGAGANTVTVTFLSGATSADIRILEYSGADPTNPVDVTAANSGNSTTTSSGSATTSNPTDLIFGANMVRTMTSGAGSGFTTRMLTSPDGDIAEDRTVTSSGSYSATAPDSPSGPWIMQMIAFRTLTAGSGSFALSASPASLNVAQGNQGTSTITTTISGGFNSGISLSASGMPSGMTATFNPATIPAPGAGTSTMTITVGSNTATGTYPITVTGSGGGVQQHTTVTLTVVAPSTAITYVQGNYATPQSAQTTVNVTFTGAQSAGDLNVVVVGWNGTTATVSSVTDRSGNSYTLGVGPTLFSGYLSQSIYYAKNIASAPAGTNAVKVSFSTAAANPDIRILEYSGADPTNPVDVTAANSGNSTTTSSGSATTSNPTDLIFGANMVRTMTTGAGSGFTTRMLTSPDGDIAEDRTVTATGSYSATAPDSPSGPWIMQMIAFRTLTAGSGSFALSASPASLNVAQGNQGTSTITSTISGGFNSGISLSASGMPTGTTASFNPTTIPAPGAGTSTMTITVGPNTATGTYPITVTGSGGGVQQHTTVTLMVTATPNFTLSASPASLNVAQGNQGTSTITTTISSGFNSGISLSASGMPSGMTATFNPATIPAPGAGTSTMTITVGSNTATGTYPITVTGSSGGVQQHTTVTLTVVAPSTAITYVQGNYATPQSAQATVNVTFTGAQTAGDLNVVVVGWNGTTATVSSVTDTSGNSYTLGVGPTLFSGYLSQSIYYAKNIASAPAGTNAVKVSFSTAAANPDIRILEYSGADPTNPVDVTAANSGNSTTTSSGSATTSNPTDLIFGANMVRTMTTGAGSGFTTRMLTSPDGDIAEDRTVTATGSYSATAPDSPSGPWIMQMIAFSTTSGGVRPPSVGSISPSSGPTAGGTAVTIAGTNFDPNATVTVGGTAALNIVVVSDNEITATTPPGTAGPASVTVTNPGTGSGSLANGFTYVPVPVLPLKEGPNDRYLVDQHGTPFLIMGDAPQAIIGNVSPSDMATYMADREHLGYNAIWVNLLCDSYTYCNSNGTTYDGVAPFTSGSSPSNYDLSTPNSAYFSRVDAMLNLALSNNLVVFLDPIETGGWLATLEHNGTTKAYNYGVYIGNRYKTFPNIVWLHGNDFQSWTSNTDNNLVKQVMAGIASVDPNHLQTIELNYNSSFSNQDSGLGSLLTLDSAYTYYETYDEVLQSYNSSPTIPTYLVEANYEYENNTGGLPSPAGPYVLREQAYWTLLSGGAGQLYGNHYTVTFTTGWQSFLDSPGALEIQYINKLFNGVAWWNLVPDASHQVVTAGYGSYDGSNANLTTATYCTTSWITDGSLALTYCPNATTLTVDLSKFSGPVTAQWYDPSIGTYTAVSGSPFPNTGTHDFTTPGDNHDGDQDWVLVLSR